MKFSLILRILLPLNQYLKLLLNFFICRSIIYLRVNCLSSQMAHGKGPPHWDELSLHEKDKIISSKTIVKVRETPCIIALNPALTAPILSSSAMKELRPGPRDHCRCARRCSHGCGQVSGISKLGGMVWLLSSFDALVVPPNIPSFRDASTTIRRHASS